MNIIIQLKFKYPQSDSFFDFSYTGIMMTAGFMLKYPHPEYKVDMSHAAKKKVILDPSLNV